MYSVFLLGISLALITFFFVSAGQVEFHPVEGYEDITWLSESFKFKWKETLAANLYSEDVHVRNVS